MIKHLAAFAVFGSATIGGAANAANFVVQYTAAGNAVSGVSASIFNGVLTISDTPDIAGFFRVLSITGTRGSNAVTLLPPGGFPADSTIPNDNLFRPAPNYFTELGISYAAGGNFYNLYFSRDLRECSSNTSVTCSFGSRNPVSGFRVTPGVVPEPATWVMMLVGFGMMGASMRHRRRPTATAYA
ncbi:PEPxxWA-CTERM sorting domain-containing protein [uncultured Sphingomonas sp.]|uniref:PEPxxWA-CTERM sorting domain-containing protein n=1 Tax=uncultured Sphingomonas sp. TaxID=158754 RepID=UPI0035CBC8DA